MSTFSIGAWITAEKLDSASVSPGAGASAGLSMVADMLCLLRLFRIVGVRRERCDADVHPPAEWKCSEKPVQLGLAVCAVQADALPLTRGGRRPPEPLEMSLASEGRRRGGLRADALFDL